MRSSFKAKTLIVVVESLHVSNLLTLLGNVSMLVYFAIAQLTLTKSPQNLPHISH